MNKKLIISISILCLVIGIYFFNSTIQKNYQSSSENLMNFQPNDLKKIIIQSGQEAIELIKKDTLWSIAGHDTLKIKQQPLDRFFDIVSKIKIQNKMTKNKENWPKYNVDDSSGVHLALVDWNNQTIGYYVFGQSKTDYARCYVRINEAHEVYLLNENIMYNLQSKPEFWGESLPQNNDLDL